MKSNLSKSDREFAKFMAYALNEWSKTHIVLTSPRLIQLFGTNVLTMVGDANGK